MVMLAAAAVAGAGLPGSRLPVQRRCPRRASPLVLLPSARRTAFLLRDERGPIMRF